MDVVIDERAWNDHVVKEHDEAKDPGWLEEVKRVIQTPGCVTDAGLSVPSGQAHMKVAYYGSAPWPFRETDLLKVVAKVGKRAAFLNSSYLVTSVPPNEVILWGTKP